MNGLIVYATHTGNTYMVASEILKVMSAKVSTLMKSASETNVNDLKDADVILMGSSSWDWQGNRGYPINEMMEFINSLGEKDLEGKKVLLFGCGDRDYEHFCGALDVMEERVRSAGAEVVAQASRLLGGGR